MNTHTIGKQIDINLETILLFIISVSLGAKQCPILRVFEVEGSVLRQYVELIPGA